MSPESKAIIHHEAVNRIQMRALELAQYAASIRVDLLIEAKVGEPIVVTVSVPAIPAPSGTAAVGRP